MLPWKVRSGIYQAFHKFTRKYGINLYYDLIYNLNSRLGILLLKRKGNSSEVGGTGFVFTGSFRRPGRIETVLKRTSLFKKLKSQDSMKLYALDITTFSIFNKKQLYIYLRGKNFWITTDKKNMSSLLKKKSITFSFGAFQINFNSQLLKELFIAEKLKRNDLLEVFQGIEGFGRIVLDIAGYGPILHFRIQTSGKKAGK